MIHFEVKAIFDEAKKKKLCCTRVISEMLSRLVGWKIIFLSTQTY